MGQLLTFSNIPTAGNFVLTDGTNYTAPLPYTSLDTDVGFELGNALPSPIYYTGVSGDYTSGIDIDGAAPLSVTTDGSGNPTLITVARTQAGGFSPGSAEAEEDFTVGTPSDNGTWIYISGCTGSDTEMGSNYGQAVGVSLNGTFLGYWLVGPGNDAGNIDFYSSLPNAAIAYTDTNGIDHTAALSTINPGDTFELIPYTGTATLNEQHTITINSQVNGGTFAFAYGGYGPWPIAWNDDGTALLGTLGAYPSPTVTPSGNTWLIDYGVQSTVTLPTVDGTNLTYPELEYLDNPSTPITTAVTQVPVWSPYSWFLYFNFNNDSSTFSINVDGTDTGPFANASGTSAATIQSAIVGQDSTFTVVDNNGSTTENAMPYLIQCTNPHTIIVDSETGSPGDSLNPVSQQDEIVTVTLDPSINGGSFNFQLQYYIAGNPNGIQCNITEAWNVDPTTFATDTGIGSTSAGGSPPNYTMDLGSGVVTTYLLPVVDGSGLVNMQPVTASIGSQSFTGDVSGGLTASGSSTATLKFPSQTSSGGLIASGSTSTKIHYSTSGGLEVGGTQAGIFGIVGTGSLTAGGSSPAGLHFNYDPSGSLTASGSAPFYVHYHVSGSGSLEASGSATTGVGYKPTGTLRLQGGAANAGPSLNYVGSGGIAFHGSAFNPEEHFTGTPTGGLVVSGSSPFGIHNLGVVSKNPLHASGSSPANTSFNYVGSNGLTITGTATHVLVFHASMNDGVELSGSSPAIVNHSYEASGSLELSLDSTPYYPTYPNIDGSGTLVLSANAPEPTRWTFNDGLLIEEAFIAYLLSQNNLTQNIYYDTIPQSFSGLLNSGESGIVISRQGEKRNPRLSDAGGWTTVTFDLEVFATAKITPMRLAQRLRFALDGFKGQWQTITVHSVHLEDMSGTYTLKQDGSSNAVYARSLTFTIQYIEMIPA